MAEKCRLKFEIKSWLRQKCEKNKRWKKKS